ncbi:MAG: thiamine pyrophosphate-dependent dehydrogenase E1 component subunit alpha [Alphaproteobacteria bacterium]|tara:strand:- start:5142 stop:6101 length:960 start_codon:yes stop_codon:yes gene_type:complete
MKSLYKNLFSSLLKLRMTENEIAKKYSEQEMRCPVHLSIGQEAAAVGVCSNLDLQDQVYSTHRCHSHYLAKGGDLRSMISELYGKRSGCCGGRGGSMHLMDPSVGMMLSLPIVASIIPIAVGAALSLKLKKKKNVISVFFGDAAVEEGVFHESANFASLNKLPIVFVCENNKYSCFTKINERQPSEDITRLAKCHNISNLRMNGNNLINVYEKSKMIIQQIKKKPEPFFLQLDTYRHVEHCGPNSDDNLNYRGKSELNNWLKDDPLENFIKFLKGENEYDQKIVNEINDKIMIEINSAFKFAKNDKFPNPASIKKFVYA